MNLPWQMLSTEK